MATIRRRPGKPGTAREAQVRRIGLRPLSKIFKRKADASAWAHEIEDRLNKGDGTLVAEGARRTLAEAVERYISRVQPEQVRVRQLQWWSENFGSMKLIQTKLRMKKIVPKTSVSRPLF